MRFCCRTFLLVCLLFPWALLAQPTANDDNASVDEDNSVTVSILDNDTPAGTIDPGTVDLDPSTTTEEKSFNATGGVFTVNMSGVLEFVPLNNFAGEATVSYTVKDGVGVSAAATVTVTVNPVNDGPSISDIGNVTINQDESTGEVSFTITDVDHDFSSLDVTATSSDPTLVPDASIQLSGTDGDRTINITPAAGASGSATITVTVRDPDDAQAQDSFVLTVNAVVQQPPVVSISGDITTLEDTPSGVITIIVTDSDTDADDLDLTAASDNIAIIPQSNVSLALVGPATWELRITPAPEQFGTTAINLEATDGTNTINDVVVVNVTSVNDLPTISTVAATTIDQDTSTPALPFTVSDVESAAGSLQLSFVSSDNPSLVSDAHVSFGGGGSNRTVTVTPEAGQFGTANITISVADENGGTSQTTFLLTVQEENAPPFFITSVEDRTIDEDVATGSLPFSVGDPNTAVASLVVTGISSNTSLVDAGGIAIGGTGASRNITVTPNINAFGITTITLRVTDDGGLFAESAFVLTVNSMNDLPTITSIDAQNIDENTSTGELSFTIGDVETAATELQLLKLSSNPSLADDDDIVLSAGGSSRSVNVIPKINQFGSTTITLTVRDADGGTAQTAFLVNVAAVDAPPTITAIDDVLLQEDTPSGDIDFTVGDIDEPVDGLTVEASSSDASIIASGGIALTEGAAGLWTLRLTPVANASGTAEITVRVEDSAGDVTTEVFTVTVNPVNDGPTISAISDQTIDEGEVLGPLPFTIADVDGLTGVIVEAASNNTTLVTQAGMVLGAGSGGNRSITITPEAGASGSATITVTVRDPDGEEAQETFDLTVNALVLQSPVISVSGDITTLEDNASGFITITVTDADTPADDLELTAVSADATLIPQANVSLVEDGPGTWRLSITPASNRSGSASINLEATDGTNIVNDVANVIVTAVNDPPTIGPITNQTMQENGTLGPVNFTVNDVDNSVDDLTVSGNAAVATLVGPGGISFGGSGAARNFTITPLPGQSGVTNVTIAVTDGEPLSAQRTFQLTVENVDLAPTITPVMALSTQEDVLSATRSFTVADDDTEQSSLVVSALSGNTTLIPNENITLTDLGAGQWTIQVMPALNLNGSTTVTLRVTDGTTVVTTPMAVTVTSVNDLPTIGTIAATTINQDASTPPLPFTLGDVETAPGSLNVSFVSSSNPSLVAAANVSFGGSGANRTVTVTPVAGQFGTANITVRVTDANSGTAQTSFVLTVLEVNAPPFFVTTIGDQAIDEDVATGSLPFSVGDPNTAVSTLVVSGTSSNTSLVDAGGIAIGGTGASRNITVTPNIDAFGTTTITLRVSDGDLFAETSFVLTVNPVNDLPTITSILAQNINENTSTGALGFTVGDLETPALSLTVSKLSSNPLLADDEDIILAGSGPGRSVNVIPKINRSGTTTITLTVRDLDGGTAQTAFLVNVAAVDAPPTITAIGDVALVEDTPSDDIEFTVGDIDEPADGLTVEVTSSVTTVVAPGGLTLTQGTGGQWTLRVTPVLNASGSTVITVRVEDADGEESTETFNVTVSPFNDEPVISPISAQNISEDQTTGPIPFTISDAETPSAGLIVTAESDNQSLVPNANITLAGSGSARTINVAPLANQSGLANITIEVEDGDGSSTTRTFAVNVAPINDEPTISSIAAQNIDEDQVDGTGDIPFTVGDAEPGTLTVTAATSNGTIVPLSNITLGGSGTSRTVKVVPLPNQFGTVTITLTVEDAQLESSSTAFNVNIAPVNDAPTITTPPPHTINENTSTGPIAFTIGDVDNAVGGLTVTRNSSNPTLFPLANVTLGGTGANRNVTAVPAASLSGTTTITLSVSDGSLTTTTSFDITVIDLADPPTISAIGDVTINEDAATAAIPFTIADPDTPTLTVTTSSDNQTLVPDANIALSGTGNARTVTVTPAANQNGVATITVSVSDGTNVVNEVFTVTVTPVNDLPTIGPISDRTVNEDTPTGNINFTVGDLETAPATLVVGASSDNTTLIPNSPTNLVLAGTGAGRTINIVPATNQFGIANITVTVEDGDGATATRVFVVTVTPVDDDPTISVIPDQTIAEDGSTGPIPFTVNDEETAASALTIEASSSNTTLVPVANVTVGGSGTNRTITVTPALNQTGTTTISVTVDDGVRTAVREFLVTVSPVNDPPTISFISDRTTNEDVSTGVISFTISDPETPSATLTVVASSDNPTLVPSGNITYGGSTGTRSITIQPALNQFGTAVITISVSDPEVTTTRTFTLTVNPVNDLPVITAQQAINIDEGERLTLNFTLLTVVDPDNTEAELTLLPTGGANYSLTGPTTITPNPAYNGPLTVPVLVSDGNGVGPLFNVTITVNSTNDAPVINGQKTLTMNEDQSLSLQLSDVTFTDADADDTNHTLIVEAGTDYTFTGTQITPAPNFNGTLTVNVRVSDGVAQSAPFGLVITVTPVNDPPAITAQTTLSTNEETEFTLIIGHFTVTDLEPTSYTLIVLPPAADAPYVLVSGNTIRPKDNVNGPITVPVRANDGQANSEIFNAVINVVPVNDPPVITNQNSLSTVEDTPITIRLQDLLVTDVDNAGYPAGFTLTILPGTNYSYNVATVTPALDYVGEILVNVQVSDGLASSNVYPVRVNVTDDADAPVILGQERPVTMEEDTRRVITTDDLNWTDTDTPESALVVNILSGTNYTFDNATATLIPNANYFGTLSVNVRLFDGEAYSNTFALQVTVSPVNDPATFNPVANITILEDSPPQTFTVTGISAGPLETSQVMIIDAVSDNTGLIPKPVATPAYNGTAPNAVFTYKPVAEQWGTATITISLVDAPPGISRPFTITVVSVNDAPTLDAITDFEMDEDSEEQIINLSGITPGGGTSEATQTLSSIVSTDNEDMFEIVPQVSEITGTTGKLKFKAKPNAFGTATVTVRIQDSGDASPTPNVNFVEQVFTITVNPTNDPPVIASTPSDIAEPGKLYVYELVVTDADNDEITIVAASLPSWLTLVQGENGHATVSGTPPQAGLPAVTLAINATDAAGVTIPAGYTLTINSRPTVFDFTVVIDEDSPLNFVAGDFEVTGFDDPDGNPLAALVIKTLPQHGVLTFGDAAVVPGTKFDRDQIAALRYTPLNNFNGTDSLRWTAADGYSVYPANDDDARLTISVSPVNDMPQFTMEAETDTLKYELGSEVPVKLTRQFHCWDVDNDLITSAEFTFRQLDGFQYRPENDQLLFIYNGPDKIKARATQGGLALEGKATAAEYDSAVRNVYYNYVNARELLLDTRSVSIQISDGKVNSSQHARIIQLIYTFEDLIIPSAFSPNEGDDVNKTWAITSPNGEGLYSDAEIKVYNKNGLLLFQTRGLDSPWTGIFNGSLLPTDTYYYTIDLHYNKVRYKGTVTLLR